MSDQFSDLQVVRKPAIRCKGGIVAAQSRKAAKIGAEVLAAGGDCVDAAISTGFALGVLEPWMSGIGGGGAMVLYRAREDRLEVIDYGARAPGSLRREDYPIVEGAASDIFPWPRVKDDRNIVGPTSIAVPGVVAGLEMAYQRHAKMPWKDLLAPSIGLAGEGLLVDWWTTLHITSSVAELRKYPASAAAYLRDGLPPNPQWGVRSTVRLPQEGLKATLAHLALAGARDFYDGDLAKSIAADVQAAYRERLKHMGDADGRRTLGAEELAPSCTTHYSVVDREGNMAAVTQTLLSIFGSKFVTPTTGITMNNGIMWFDPTPRMPNSLAPGKRCLSNYTPVVARTADRKMLALGASGGRRILPAVAQLLSFVMDFGMDLDAAIHQPRIDASEGNIVIADIRLPREVRDVLRAQFDYEEARVQHYPGKFAFPSLVLRDGTINFGATQIFHPWADVVAED